jgi:hypothetical protein
MGAPSWTSASYRIREFTVTTNHIIYILLQCGIFIVFVEIHKYGKQAKWGRAKFIMWFVAIISTFFILDALRSYAIKYWHIDL